jgi:tRNA1Val (adenine37-N6)-methyltransferase
LSERVDDELTSDAITADYRILQRKRGHRYSLDDVLTAATAVKARPDARLVLDLGTGVGSVLLMMAWKLPDASLVGIEAQSTSFALLERNLMENGLGVRARAVFGDFREEAVREQAGGPFSLVTGTPPYFPLGTASISPDPQRAHARMELRGGVEAYLEAASALLDHEGIVVICADARAPERVLRGAESVGLHAHACIDAIPRRGKPPLFSVFTLTRMPPRAQVRDEFVAREADGARSAEYVALRGFFGLTQREGRA